MGRDVEGRLLECPPRSGPGARGGSPERGGRLTAQGVPSASRGFVTRREARVDRNADRSFAQPKANRDRFIEQVDPTKRVPSFRVVAAGGVRSHLADTVKEIPWCCCPVAGGLSTKCSLPLPPRAERERGGVHIGQWVDRVVSRAWY